MIWSSISSPTFLNTITSEFCWHLHNLIPESRSLHIFRPQKKVLIRLVLLNSALFVVHLIRIQPETVLLTAIATV